ncbi:MAG TPA: DUF927 domain-containing protein [Gemmataceae bacterium]|nr:DUF927 domain-containing protein [Gemmataceae bacterium]
MSIGSSWVRVKSGTPCPVCKKTDWCAVTADGQLARCQRVEQGAFRIDTDVNGTPYYLHRLTDAARPAVVLPLPSRSDTKRADPDTLHLVYEAFLAQLVLSKSHRENLRRRGLSDPDIDHRQYRSLPRQGRAKLARDLAERFGVETLLSVPGFVQRNKDGRHYLTIFGNPGLLVSVRDTAGRIAALKVRRDDDGTRSRYSYLSSAKHGGPGAGAPVHVPRGVTGPCREIRLTEGELKSDVATSCSKMPTLGVNGVAAKAALPVLRELQAKTVRLAFDADAAQNKFVARALSDAYDQLLVEGFAVEVERWAAEHKGIDDALAAGAAIEVLTGDQARSHIVEMLALATAGEPLPPPSPLDRLDNVLAEGGTEALFHDAALLKALAHLAHADPAEFACKRAVLKNAGVALRDLDRVLAPYRQAQRAAQPTLTSASDYRVNNGCLAWVRPTRDGPVETALANFRASIVEEVSLDDGAEKSVRLIVEGALQDGTALPRVEVRAEDFGRMEWVLPSWGTRAVIAAGRGVADHLRCAIQSLSGNVPCRTVYGHLGWRRVAERWLYLHAGGAIGGDGPAADISVSLPDALAHYVFPEPPSDERLRTAIRASLALLDLGSRRITFVLLSAVYRAVLGSVDFALHFVGESGAFKTEVSTLALQHFGAGMHSRNLPASWGSTGNFLEALAFVAKDALLLIDEFTPQNGHADIARLHREAERLFRAQGNSAGRQRMRRDGSLAPSRSPRGLILSTGEEEPRGQSLRARLLTLEIEKADKHRKGDIDRAKLTTAQELAAKGAYAEAMAGFVRWLARRYEVVRDRLATDRAKLREQAAVAGEHARTAGIVADLALGLRYCLEYAEASGAIDSDRRRKLWEEGWTSLRDSGSAQRETIEDEEPTACFLRLLRGAIACGRAHLANAKGDYPEAPSAWGWREDDARQPPTWKPQGARIGWIDGGAVLLEPTASYGAAQEMAHRQGHALPVTARTLWKRLFDRGLLASRDEKRQRNTIRRTLESVKDRDVLHLRMEALFTPGEAAEEDVQEAPIPF